MKIISKLFLCLALIITTFSSFASAEEKQNVGQDVSITDSQQIRFITKEEYYEAIAKGRNISIQEAEKITKETIKDHQKSIREKNLKNNGSSSQSDVTPQIIDWGSSWGDGYGGNYYNAYVYKQYDAGGGMLVEVGVPALIYIYNSYGREFVSIEASACYAQPVSSGNYTYNAFAKTASLQNNKVYLSTRGSVETSVSLAANLGISAADLVSFGFEVSGSYTYRKTISISHVESLY